MEMPEKKLIETLVTGSIIGTLGTLIATLMSNKPPREKIKNLLAGILAVILVTFILRNSTWAQTLKECLIGCTGAFIGIYWPELESLIKWIFELLRWVLKKFIGKKLNIDIPDDIKTKTNDVPNNDNNQL